MSLEADEAFQMARDKIFKGESREGRKILRHILQNSPDHYDVRILLARSYAWDKEPGLARKELQLVLAKHADNEDAISALTDVEMWDGQFDQALITVDTALYYYPNSSDFLFKKAGILFKLNRPDDALEALNALMAISPNHEKGAALEREIRNDKLKYYAGISYGLDLFSSTFDPAHLSTVQVSKTNPWGSAIFRLNYASRFSSRGLQPELELYPKIMTGVYAYLNYGYSESTLFSRHRVGGEIYSKLPKSLEASAGIRYLYFESGSQVLIYTGSLGWYLKNYWLSYRPYITADNARASFSSAFALRRYLADGENYLGFNGGFGFSPDERRIQSGAGLSTERIYILKSQNVGITWQTKFPRNFILKVNYALIHQELSFDLGQYVWINSTLIEIKKKF